MMSLAHPFCKGYISISIFYFYMGYMKIVYRKGSENDYDALIRWEDLANLTEESILNDPILKQIFEDYDAGIFEKELEDPRESRVVQ